MGVGIVAAKEAGGDQPDLRRSLHVCMQGPTARKSCSLTIGGWGKLADDRRVVFVRHELGGVISQAMGV